MKNRMILMVDVIVLMMSAFTFAPAQHVEPAAFLDIENAPFSIERELSKYIQVPSVSGSERQAGEYLRKRCAENGLHIQQMGDRDGNYNFAASLRPLSEGLPNIIFLNHIDVVPVGDSTRWIYPPFSGRLVAGELWGRGAVDNKGAAIMQLSAIIDIARSYVDQAIPYNVTFLAVSCEETQCIGGARYVVNHYLEALNPFVVIGEGPPGLKGILRSDPDAYVFGISVAHKRALWLELEIDLQTSAHGAVPPAEYATKEMVDALDRLLDRKPKVEFTDLNIKLLKQLGELEKGLPAFVLRRPRLFKNLIVPRLRRQPELLALFSNTLSLTALESQGEAINAIPGRVTARLDCRLLPTTSRDVFLQEVTKRLDNPAIRISVIEDMPEAPPSENDAVYQRLERAILQQYPAGKVLPVMLPNFNDSGLFRSKGIPVFSVLPIRSDLEHLSCIHNLNERIAIEDLRRGAAMYTTFLNACLGGATSRQQVVQAR